MAYDACTFIINAIIIGVTLLPFYKNPLIGRQWFRFWQGLLVWGSGKSDLREAAAHRLFGTAGHSNAVVQAG
jgi:hypothetical protein